MLEVSRVGIAEGDEEIELSLELSIGGSYGKLEKLKQEEDSGKENEKGVEDIVQRSGFSFPETMILGDQLDRESGSGSEVFESQKKREIQALRRQEARRKREEKQLRKSGSNGVANENDLLWLEAQKLQARVRDRELRENDGLLEESARKKEEISKCGDKDYNFTFRNCEIGNEKNDLGPKVAASCLQNVPVIMQMPGPYSELQPKNGFVYPLHNVVGKEENEIKGRNVFRPMGCGSFRPYPNANGKLKHDLGCDSEQSSAIKKVISNGSQERSSSAISDYQSASGKGGSSSETGSHSSCFIANEQQFGVPATNDKLAKTESNGSSDKNGLGQVPGVEVSANVKVVAPTSESKEPTNVAEGSNSMGCLPQMPCVSATGNGPNGKTITGFLYRYTKTEVSIVCVCHGTSFSPAEFVEHAGGTDITNPLRHITMIPSSFE